MALNHNLACPDIPSISHCVLTQLLVLNADSSEHDQRLDRNDSSRERVRDSDYRYLIMFFIIHVTLVAREEPGIIKQKSTFQALHQIGPLIPSVPGTDRLSLTKECGCCWTHARKLRCFGTRFEAETVSVR
jgi:hypothetical protein